MSSMTDLVFLLLIFFIILSTLVSNGVNVELPKAKGTTSVTSKMTLSIKPDGSYHLNGGPVAYEDLESLLRVRLADSQIRYCICKWTKQFPPGRPLRSLAWPRPMNGRSSWSHA